MAKGGRVPRAAVKDDRTMYEPRNSKPLPFLAFLQRMALHVAVAAAMTLVTLAFGMVGYRYLDALPWTEAFMHSATPLAGMGVTHIPNHTWGHIFTGFYAITSSFVFLVVSAVLYAPLIHRLLHSFHVDDEDA